MTDYELAVRLWRKFNIQNDSELSEVLKGYDIAFAYHSGKIENEKITRRDIKAIFEHDSVTAYTGDLRTLFEIRNARDAAELFLTAFNERRIMDETLVKEFQSKLTENTYDTRSYQLGERPSEYKKHDYAKGGEEVGAPSEDTAKEMNELLAEIQDIPMEKALIGSAYFHAKLESIHPFAVGNGRTGRLLMNYFLVIRNHPPIIIHEDDRKSYFKALEAWDTEQDLLPMIVFLQQQTVKTWKKQMDRLNVKPADEPANNMNSQKDGE